MNSAMELREAVRILFGRAPVGGADAAPFSTRDVVKALYCASVGCEPSEAQLSDEIAQLAKDPTLLSTFAVQLREANQQAFRARRLLSDHSQFGELGILLRELVEAGRSHGIVVDVGANGRQGSNSYDLLADFGWKGLLVEANPKLVDRIRFEFDGLNCALVNCAIGLTSGRQMLHIGIDDQISSLDQDSVLKWGERVGGIEVEVRRLEDVLEEHRVPHDFDVLSIDIEGMDAAILNDMVATTPFRPRWIVAEVEMPFHGGPTLADTQLSAQIIAEYELANRTLPNLILRRR